jgi:PAB-dependent poly(A)-specific ribonuclease subunit 2
MAFGDADGTVHLMSAAAEGEAVPFNGFEGHAVEWADAPAPLPDIVWTDSTCGIPPTLPLPPDACLCFIRSPLNSIGLPHYTARLLSSYTKQLLPTSSGGQPLFPAPPKIPPQVLAGMKHVDRVGYATLPKELRGRRNVVVAPKKAQARFRSGRMQRVDVRAFS